MSSTDAVAGDDDACVDARTDAGAGDGFDAAQHEACDQLAALVGRAAACRATGLPRSSWYRVHRQSPAPPRPAPIPHAERAQPRALSAAERDRVRDVLNSPEFVDEAPATVWAKQQTADGTCSPPTDRAEQGR